MKMNKTNDFDILMDESLKERLDDISQKTMSDIFDEIADPSYEDKEKLKAFFDTDEIREDVDKISDTKTNLLQQMLELRELQKTYSRENCGRGNCYIMAGIGAAQNPLNEGRYFYRPSPGFLAGDRWTLRETFDFASGEDTNRVKEILVDKWSKDLSRLGKDLQEIYIDSPVGYNCAPGERLVALMYTPNLLHTGADFHFMVKGSQDYFFHKQGVLDVTDRDNEGRLITDPGNCASPYDVLGYFIVKDKE